MKNLTVKTRRRASLAIAIFLQFIGMSCLFLCGMFASKCYHDFSASYLITSIIMGVIGFAGQSASSSVVHYAKKLKAKHREEITLLDPISNK